LKRFADLRDRLKQGPRNRQNNRFTDLLKIIILEVPETEDRPFRRWMRFFKCRALEKYGMRRRNTLS
jgi:hypothetical protein